MAPRNVRVGNTLHIREEVNCAGREILSTPTSEQVNVVLAPSMAVRLPKVLDGRCPPPDLRGFHA